MRVRRNALPFLQLDSGTAGPWLVANQALAGMLIDADIPFHFTQRRGGHDPGLLARKRTATPSTCTTRRCGGRSNGASRSPRRPARTAT